MQQQMRDPAAGVPRELLPHMHLVSKYRYPLVNQMSLDTVISYLTEAPKIVHDLQPVVWQFLEAPPDGTVLLVWQPLDYLGTNLASDGYVWGDAEQAFNSDHNGYMVEVWLHRGGYYWPNEPFTAHSRKRYRLTQSKNPSALPCDPSLWIVHYSRAERENVIPSNQLPLQPHVQAALNQRRFLQSQGQLARKEFMLHDKANWPTINLPSAQALQYPPHMVARQQQQHQQQKAAAQIQITASPLKNISDRNQHRRGPSIVLEPSLEEEEDVSRGDVLDFMTPRDISRMRYEQHHEWMEEIMSSPFAMKQIMPTDLGLGRKGELEALTSGFFDTPTSVLQDTSANASNVPLGRMDVAKAEEFTTKAAKKVVEMEAELDTLKKRHARRMAKLDKSSSLATSEKRLRTAVVDGGRPSLFEHGEAGSRHGARTNVDDVVRDVETTSGKKIVPISIVECVQKGGLEEKIPNRKPSTTAELPSPEKGMNGSRANLSTPASPGVFVGGVSPSIQQQQDIVSNLSPTSPADLPSHGHGVQQPVVGGTPINGSALPSLEDLDVDVEMAGLNNDDQQGGEPTGDNDGGEWVMVDNLNAGNATERPPADSQAQGEPPKKATESPAAASAPAFANTPTESGLQGLTPAEPAGEALDGAETMTTDHFDLGQGDFDANIDETGGLVDFGDDHEDLNLEGMDESAFGDAFHPPEENQSHLPEHGDMS